MDPKRLVRDPNKVQSVLKPMGDGSIVCVKPCKIYIPCRFAEQQLAFVGSETQISGIFAIVVEDKYYGVSLVNAMMRIDPTDTKKVMVQDVENYEFSFAAGSKVILNRNLEKSDTFIYYIYNEIVATGHVPWFFSYEDLGRLFESGGRHAGMKVGASHVIPEMIAAAISRDHKDRTKYYRQVIKTKADLDQNPPEFIALRSVIYGATNTTAKLMGAYFDDGLTSALVNPSEKVEPIENLLRQ